MPLAPATDRSRLLLILTIAALAVGALFPPIAGAPRLGRALADAAHLPAFGFLTFVLARHASGYVGRAMLLAGASALAIELLQSFVGRTPSLRDLAVGWLGIALAGATLGAHRRGRRRALWIAGLAWVPAVLFVLTPAWIEWRTWSMERQSFPGLGAFEQEWELRLWLAREGEGQAASRVGTSVEGATAGDRSLRIETDRGSWGGVQYEGGVADWSRFSALTFTVVNPRDAFELHLRLEQACACREPPALTLRYPIAPGENRLRVGLDSLPGTPEGPPLELARVARFALFTGDDEPPRTWFLDDVRLVP